MARHTHLPVFLDRSGRRRRVLVAVGGAAVVAITGAVVALALALGGGAGQAPPGLPDARVPHGGSQPAISHATPATVSSTAVPAARASPSPTRPGNGHRHTPTQTPSHKK
jgi:hypothetical protein